MRDLVLKSSEWLRGVGPSGLSNGSKHCCLGVDAIEMGVPLSIITECHGPSSLVSQFPSEKEKLAHWLIQRSDMVWNADYTFDAMEINDDRWTTDEEKIARLTPIFASRGINLIWEPTL